VASNGGVVVLVLMARGRGVEVEGIEVEGRSRGGRDGGMEGGMVRWRGSGRKSTVGMIEGKAEISAFALE
jgi:hypothetical protein